MEQKNQNEVFEWSHLGDFFQEHLDINIEDQISKSALMEDKGISQLVLLSESNNIGDFLKKKGINESIEYGLEKNKPQYSQILTGSNENIINLDGWQTAEFLKDLLRETPEYIEDYSNQNFQLLVFAEKLGINTGLGKSYDVFAIAEMLRFIRDIPKSNQYTNIKDDVYNDIPSSKTEFLKMLEDDKEENIIILDEAAQFLMYADQKWGKDLSQKIKMARHNNNHIIYVGHTGADIPADIRKSVIVNGKSDIKEGKIGFGIIKGQGDKVNIQKELFKYENMPEPIDPPPQQPDLIIPGISPNGETSKEEVHMCQAETRQGGRCQNEAELFDETGLAVCNDSHKGFYYNDNAELPKYHPNNPENPHVQESGLPVPVPKVTEKLDRLKELSKKVSDHSESTSTSKSKNNFDKKTKEIENLL